MFNSCQSFLTSNLVNLFLFNFTNGKSNFFPPLFIIEYLKHKLFYQQIFTNTLQQVSNDRDIMYYFCNMNCSMNSLCSFSSFCKASYCIRNLKLNHNTLIHVQTLYARFHIYYIYKNMIYSTVKIYLPCSLFSLLIKTVINPWIQTKHIF